MSNEEKTLSRRGFLTAALAAIPATAILAVSADTAEAGGLTHKHYGHKHHKVKRHHKKKVYGRKHHYGHHHKYHGYKGRRRASIKKGLKFKKIFKF